MQRHLLAQRFMLPAHGPAAFAPRCWNQDQTKREVRQSQSEQQLLHLVLVELIAIASHLSCLSRSIHWSTTLSLSFSWPLWEYHPPYPQAWVSWWMFFLERIEVFFRILPAKDAFCWGCCPKPLLPRPLTFSWHLTKPRLLTMLSPTTNPTPSTMPSSSTTSQVQHEGLWLRWGLQQHLLYHLQLQQWKVLEYNFLSV